MYHSPMAFMVTQSPPFYLIKSGDEMICFWFSVSVLDVLGTM